jgi:hypothetical protein
MNRSSTTTLGTLTRLAATAVLSAAALAGVGGCQSEPATPSQSTKEGTGLNKTPAGMEKPMPEGKPGTSATPPSPSAKEGTGANKIPAGMERPSPEPTPAAGDLTHVLTAETPYYKSSPAQGKPADGKLKGGTKLLLLMPAGSYSQVWAETGVKAYVPTDSIQAINK